MGTDARTGSRERGDSPPADGSREGTTRRDMLRTAAALAGAGGLGMLGGSGIASAAARASIAAAPKRGGTLRAGVTSGSSADTLDPHTWLTNADGTRVYQLFDSLLAFDKNAQPQLSLAQEVTPNKNATAWTIRLRKGITFHNGKPVTADDVIYTFQRVLNPKKPLLGAANMAPLNIAAAKKLDALTVRIPCHTPFAAFAELQACYQYFIVPVGFNPKKPIGTGPFKAQSFTPGQQSTFVRNPNYWQRGLPYVDTLVISDYADETSQINGLISGQLDVIDSLSADSIAAVTNGGGKIVVSEGGSYTPFTMRLDQSPFNDIRVRQALRLVVDRKQMIKLVFGNYGQIGNDLFGLYDSAYDHALPQRTQDIEQAKSLLKKAGHEKLNLTLVTADIAAGSIKAAEVFAQQASAAGVTVTLQQVPVSTIYGPNYLKWTFAQDTWTYYPYLPNAQEALIPGGVFNECHVNDPAYNKLFKQLAATTDPKARTELTHECQTREYNGNASGYIVPYFQPEIDATSSHVHGLTPSKTSNPFGGFDLASIWLS